MHHVFGIFRPLRINHVCDNFHPHGRWALQEALSKICSASSASRLVSRSMLHAQGLAFLGSWTRKWEGAQAAMPSSAVHRTQELRSPFLICPRPFRDGAAQTQATARCHARLLHPLPDMSDDTMQNKLSAMPSCGGGGGLSIRVPQFALPLRVLLSAQSAALCGLKYVQK